MNSSADRPDSFVTFNWLAKLCSAGNGDHTQFGDDGLRQAAEVFQSLADTLPLNLLVKDSQCRLVFANRVFLEYEQVSLQDILGKTDFDLCPEELAKKYYEDDQQVLTKGVVLQAVEEHEVGDGERRYVECVKGPVRDADGVVVGLQLVFWDVTDRIRAQEAFDRERQLMHALMEWVPESIYFKDRESRFLRVSRAMAEKFGLSRPEEALGKTDAEVFSAEHSEQAWEDEQEIMRKGEPLIDKVEKETWTDRDDTWVSTTKAPLRDKAGKIVGTFGISRDVTKQKLAEAVLAQQALEARLLHRTTTMAAEQDSFEKALAGCLEGVCEITGWPVGHVYVPSDNGNYLEPTDIWRLTDSQPHNTFREVTGQTTFAKGVELPGRIWMSGKPAWIADVRSDAGFSRAQLCPDVQVRGAFGFPIKIQGKVAAVLEFFAEEPMPVDSNLLMVLSNVGEQVGHVLERQRAAGTA